MKKGFTLVELLAVIIVLSAILLIIIPSVNHIITNSKISLSDTQIKSIESAAKQYYLEEGMDENKSCVNVNYLLENGYIESEKIVNPKDGEEVTGSVKIEYRNNKYTYKYTDEKCGICTVLSGEGTSIGDKLECEVKPGTKYNFYVLSKEDDTTTNLIMDRNIGSALWISEEDFLSLGGTKEDLDSQLYGKLGPVTLMKEVDNLTKDWSNIPNLDIVYNDAGGSFTNFKITAKARLPYYRELDSPLTDIFLFDNMYVECLDDDDNEVDCDVATNIMGNAQYVNVGDDHSYGVFDTADPTYSYYFYWDGGLMDSQISFDSMDDIRPVINVPNDYILSPNPPVYICESVDEDNVTTGYIPEGEYNYGDEYICEVKPGTEYHFFVLSEGKDNINLIMNRNICEDGTFATESKKCYINWDSSAYTDKGPTTAMEYLNSATSTWNNIANLNIVYDDEGGHFTEYEITGKARLPYLKEVDGLVSKNTIWLIDYMDGTYDGDYGIIGRNNSIPNISAYWTLSTDKDFSSGARLVELYGNVGQNLAGSSYAGVRPVINVSKNSIK